MHRDKINIYPGNKLRLAITMWQILQNTSVTLFYRQILMKYVLVVALLESHLSILW